MSYNCNQNSFDYLKFIASIIVIAASLVLLSLYITYPWSFALFKEEKLSDIIMILLAGITLVLTIWEYLNHRKRIKAEVLGQYNKRYSEDEHINKVVPFLISDIMKEKIVKVSVHDVEMFMRFFEEIELQIEIDRLDAESVYDLFSYYALYLDSRHSLLESLTIDDYIEENWKLYLKFVNRMALIYFRNTIWHCDNNSKDIINFDDSGYLTYKEGRIKYKYQKGEFWNLNDLHPIGIQFLMNADNDNKKEKEILLYEDRKYSKQ